MNPERRFGPNMLRLIAVSAARVAVPPGGGLADALASLSSKERIMDTVHQAVELADAALFALRSAPDNPYGNDEETLAGAILNNLNIPD